MRLTTSREIVVETPDEVGVLLRVTGAVCESHVNIKAICGYGTDGTAHVRLITENNRAAIEALKKAGFQAEEHVVLVSEASPHVARPQLEGVGDNFEVENNYWCAATHNGEHAILVFSPADNTNRTAHQF